MEADVVVNFLNFYINAEEEELSSVLVELQAAGIVFNTVDRMFERLLQCNENSDETSGGKRKEVRGKK